jgi:hypothetical protein
MDRIFLTQRSLDMSEMLTKTEVVSRGWTKYAMTKLLAEPDSCRENPNNLSRPIKLFKRARVEDLEKTPTFKLYQAKGEVRRARFRICKLPKHSYEKLYEASLNWYNSHQIEPNEISPNNVGDYGLKQVAVDYLDCLCRDIYQSTNTEKIMNEIVSVYPALKPICVSRAAAYGVFIND